MGAYNHNNCIKPVISMNTLYEIDKFKFGVDFPLNGEIIYKNMKFNGFQIKAVKSPNHEDKLILGGNNITSKYEVDDSAIIVDNSLIKFEEDNKIKYFVSTHMKNSLVDLLMKNKNENNKNEDKIENFKESFKYTFTEEDILELPIENLFHNTIYSINYIPKLLSDGKITKEVYNNLIYDESLYYKLFIKDIGSLSKENRNLINNKSLGILDRKMPLYMNDVRLTFLDYFGDDTIFMEKWNSLNSLEKNAMFNKKNYISENEIIIPVLHGMYLIFKIPISRDIILDILNNNIINNNENSNYIELEKPKLIFAFVFKYINENGDPMDIPIVFLFDKLPYNEIIEFLNSSKNNYDIYQYFKIMDNIHENIGYSY